MFHPMNHLCTWFDGPIVMNEWKILSSFGVSEKSVWCHLRTFRHLMKLLAAVGNNKIATKPSLLGYSVQTFLPIKLLLLTKLQILRFWTISYYRNNQFLAFEKYHALKYYNLWIKTQLSHDNNSLWILQYFLNRIL